MTIVTIGGWVCRRIERGLPQQLELAVDCVDTAIMSQHLAGSPTTSSPTPSSRSTRSQRPGPSFGALRLVALQAVASLIAVTACGGVPGPAQYPDLKLSSSQLELRIDDPRREFAKPITEPVTMGRGEDDTYPQQLPTTFEAKANARLARLTSGQGPKLQVNTEVRRADVTFYNDPFRGDFVRYDVVLGFRVTTTTGALLHKGSGGSWQELPHAKATSAEMRRVFEEVALAAFDRYFASEDTLEKIEAQLERYLETHPQ